MKILFTGKDVPMDHTEFAFSVYSSRRQLSSEDDGVRVRVQKNSDRVYTIGLEVSERSPRVDKVVLRFRERRFVCPVMYGEE